jgi:hypothetical protein
MRSTRLSGIYERLLSMNNLVIDFPRVSGHGAMLCGLQVILSSLVVFS